MSIDLSIRNFRNIAELRLQDDKAMSIIVGLNESGKSSLVGAIQYACTGTAFGRKSGATVDGLVRRGADKMDVRLCINNIMVTRTKTTGDTIKAIAERFGVTTETLPLLFDSKMSGDGGSKAMRAFLDGAASSAFDALSHFATDPPIYELVLKARASGKLTTKAIIQYCDDMRASCRMPTAPVMPGTPRPTPDQIQKAYQDVVNAQALERESTAFYTDAALMGNKFARLNQYKADLATYEKQRAAAATIDPLKERRHALIKVVNINVESLRAVHTLIQNAEIDIGTTILAAIASVDQAIITAKFQLSQNPAPATMPTPPVLDAEAFALLVELGSTATDSVTAIAELTIDQLRSFLTESATNTTEMQTALKQNSENARLLEAVYNNMTKQLGAWESYDRSVPAYEDNKLMVETDWKRWDTASKTIAAAETAHVNKAGDVFGNLVSEFSASILQGRKVRVSRDEGIWLGQDSIDDCSESTRWRVEASVMAAIAVMLKSPLLILDGADILDPVNKKAVIGFLLQNIVPRFTHTLVTTTTARPIEEEEPAGPNVPVTKWIINNGELRKLG